MLFHPIVREGVIDQDIVEANPVVFKGELYRFDCIRQECFSKPYHKNLLGKGYSRLVRVRDNVELPPIAVGLTFTAAFAVGDRMIVTGVDDHKTERHYIYQLESEDLIHWTEPRVIFGGPNWRIHNTGWYQADGRYLLTVECDYEYGHPEKLFCMRFLETTDFVTYAQVKDAIYGPGYTGGCILRYINGWHYIFYITGDYTSRFDWNIARSRDLKTWEPSSMNPIMVCDDAEDKKLNPLCILTDEQVAVMKQARNINVSDMDFCEYNGALYMIYSWGDQNGHEYYALASCNASEQEFCEQYFN